jgi:hypothetical protein
MSARERVHSPADVRLGDRLEVVGARAVIAMDALWWDHERWHGVIATIDGVAEAACGHRLAVGMQVAISERSYPLGAVFRRRRSREDVVVGKAREEQR